MLVDRRTTFEGGRLIKLTNLYRLPIEPPPLPEWESLLRRRDSEIQESIPYDTLTGTLRRALDALAARIAGKEVCS
jgi:hypothetical protein